MTKQTRKKSDTNVPDTTVQDIAHEEIKTDTSGYVTEIPKILTTDEQIKQELAKFNVAESAIAALKQNYGGLVIAGQDDKDGYKAVREAWGDVRSKRVSLEKKGLELRQSYTVITKAISKEEDRLIDLITPLEQDLHKKWKAIDDEKDKIQKALEDAEQKELMGRIEELQECGMSFSDGFYLIGDTISVDVASLRAMPQDQLDKLKTAVRAKAAEMKAEKERAAEAKRKEAEDLQRQQDELRKQREEFQKQQDEMKTQREELEKQQLAMSKHKLEIRVSKYLEIGMSQITTFALDFNNGYSETAILLTTIAEMTDQEFHDSIGKHQKFIADARKIREEHDLKVKHDQEILERKKRHISDLFEKIGMSYRFSSQDFKWSDANAERVFTMGELLELDDDTLMAELKKSDKLIADYKRNTETMNKLAAAEAEKEKNMLLSDKQRFDQLAAAIQEIADQINPESFKTAKWRNFFSSLKSNLIKLIQQ